jgi:hypothetical protein
MRNFVTLVEAKEAVRKCFAASWSMAIVVEGPPLPPAPVGGILLVSGSCWKNGMSGFCIVLFWAKGERGASGPTSRPNHIIRHHSVKNLLSIGRTLDIRQAGDQHLKITLAPLAEGENLFLMVQVADYTDYRPGAIEQEGG